MQSTRSRKTYKDQNTRDVDYPQKPDPLGIGPLISKLPGEKVEAEGDNDEETEGDELDDKADFHDIEAVLGRVGIIRDAGDTAEDLDEKGHDVEGYEDGRHPARRYPEVFDGAEGDGCGVHDNSPLFFISTSSRNDSTKEGGSTMAM
ncbi:hypothetical protein B7494_g4978 [Chlorociboria aeruginascens]|nr:hypothetical protein B7494_g4978 [Chlorociboria aeruginascens]